MDFSEVRRWILKKEKRLLSKLNNLSIDVQRS